MNFFVDKLDTNKNNKIEALEVIEFIISFLKILGNVLMKVNPFNGTSWTIFLFELIKALFSWGFDSSNEKINNDELAENLKTEINKI